MARQRMVTRTVNQTTCKIMCLNTNTAEVSIIEQSIGGTYDDATLLKKMQSIYETSHFKLVSIMEQRTEEVLLGMSEEDFIRLATVLPPRGTKVEADEN